MEVASGNIPSRDADRPAPRSTVRSPAEMSFRVGDDCLDDLRPHRNRQCVTHALDHHELGPRNGIGGRDASGERYQRIDVSVDDQGRHMDGTQRILAAAGRHDSRRADGRRPAGSGPARKFPPHVAHRALGRAEIPVPAGPAMSGHSEQDTTPDRSASGRAGSPSLPRSAAAVRVPRSKT